MSITFTSLDQPQNFSHPVKSREMMIRDLSNRIYQLLRRLTNKEGKSFVQLMDDLEHKHHQYLFDRIYKFIHTNYFSSAQLHQSSSTELLFLVEEGETYYLRSSENLWEILNLFGIHQDYTKISAPLNKFLSPKMFVQLLKEIPPSRILYKDRDTPSPYRFNVIETTTLKDNHPDGNPIPSFIKNIYIHKIYKFHGSFVKIWELVPRRIKHPTPICLIPGFGSNYYSFHAEGNDSIDYYLVQSGSHVFILDHERKDEDANIDVYVEYLGTTMIDFVRERTNLPQVIFGGHSMGGMITICKTILDAVRRPRLVTAIKALIIINSPIDFEDDFFIPRWLVQFQEMLLDLIGYEGNFPLEELVTPFSKIPFWEHVLCMDSPNWLKKLQKIPLLEFNRLLQTVIDFQFNPFTIDPPMLRTLTEKALTNPPRMVLNHFATFIKTREKGITSYNYEEFSTPLYDVQDFSQTAELSLTNRKVGINYTKNLFRISPVIPLLTIQNEKDILSPPSAFYQFWNSWPHLNKLRLDHTPSQKKSTKTVVRNIRKFLQESGVSSAIGVTVSEGRHLDALRTEKELIRTFIEEVEQLPYSTFHLVQKTVEAHQRFLERGNNADINFIAERDFAKKIRFIIPQVFWAERTNMIKLLWNLLLGYQPNNLPNERLQNFMVRDTKKIEDTEEVKYDVLDNCVLKILAFQPEPIELIKRIEQQIMNIETTTQSAGYRSLIDLSLGLFDISQQRSDAIHQEFIKHLKNFLEYSLKCADHRVALHALRAFFHTKDEEFISKGGELIKQLPEAWQQQASRIYWQEMKAQIGELKKSNTQDLHQVMKPYLKVAKEIIQQHQK